MRDKKHTKYICDCCEFTVMRTENTLPSDWSSLRTPLNMVKPAAIHLCGGCTQRLLDTDTFKAAIARCLLNYPFSPETSVMSNSD